MRGVMRDPIAEAARRARQSAALKARLRDPLAEAARRAKLSVAHKASPKAKAARAKLYAAMHDPLADAGRRAKLRASHTRHGHTGTGWMSRSYQIWKGMIVRCLNPRTKNYVNYGARGITVCARWMRFEHFLADMGERPPGRSLDRINNEGSYEPGNCRWATRQEQNRNRRPRTMATRRAAR